MTTKPTEGPRRSWTYRANKESKNRLRGRQRRSGYDSARQPKAVKGGAA